MSFLAAGPIQAEAHLLKCLQPMFHLFGHRGVARTDTTFERLEPFHFLPDQLRFFGVSARVQRPVERFECIFRPLETETGRDRRERETRLAQSEHVLIAVTFRRSGRRGSLS